MQNRYKYIGYPIITIIRLFYLHFLYFDKMPRLGRGEIERQSLEDAIKTYGLKLN